MLREIYANMMSDITGRILGSRGRTVTKGNKLKDIYFFFKDPRSRIKNQYKNYGSKFKMFLIIEIFVYVI